VHQRKSWFPGKIYNNNTHTIHISHNIKSLNEQLNHKGRDIHFQPRDLPDVEMG
jgi:hypothetical protein